MLLSLIGLVILILAMVFLVPVRYRIFFEQTGEHRNLSVNMHWLLHLLSFRGALEESGEFGFRLKAMGITIFSNSKEWEKKQEEKRVRRTEKEKKTDKNKQSPKRAEKKSLSCEEEGHSSEKIIADTEDKLEKQTFSKAEKKSEKSKQVVFQKIKNKWREFIDKWYSFWRGFKEKVNFIKKLFKNGKTILKKGVIFLMEEECRGAFGNIFLQIKIIGKHLWPRKLKGTIRYGTGDPCSTGQAFGVLAIIYTMSHCQLQIIPDFQEKILEGNIMAKGRARLFTMGKICITLIKDEKVKQLKNKIQTLKEEL